MNDLIFIWDWEITEPKYYGMVRQIKLNKEKESMLQKSLSMKCENCSYVGDHKIYETHKKWHLFFFIPLGTSDYLYKAYCEKCNAHLITLKSKDIRELEKIHAIE